MQASTRETTLLFDLYLVVGVRVFASARLGASWRLVALESVAAQKDVSR